ncbi:MFS transporter [Sphingomonas sp.]|uniref:MFS transporter n=1 Tax=Sphingomonas sp. TaxID=28214 RepID=UPI001B0EBA64|nr:MFS transporter [Sphingomonas sp.]MBO9711564.1 MFS transporter [Sphingomonas sp.]
MEQGAAPRPLETRVTRLLLANGFANAGGVIAFLPLLSLLLPVKIEAMAGDARLDVLTAAVIVGAIAASGSNILFGWLSDVALARGHGRRTWLGAGLAATALSYAGVAAATTPAAIVAAIACFQVAVNALLAPMFAIMADEIPDAHKRTAGGLLAIGHPLGAAMSTVLVGLSVAEEGRLAVIAGVVALFVVPLLFVRGAMAEPAPESSAQRQLLRGDLVIAWTSRLLVQAASAMLSYYLVYYFESIAPGTAPHVVAQRVGTILTISLFIPLPIAILLGRWSDRARRGKPFLLGSALVAAAGLVAMALARDWVGGAAAFALYSIGAQVFLSIQIGFAMQLLPDARHRGRDLGLMNLTNTLPQFLGPGMAWLLATPHDFDGALLALAGFTGVGAVMILAVRGRR